MEKTGIQDHNDGKEEVSVRHDRRRGQREGRCRGMSVRGIPEKIK